MRISDWSSDVCSSDLRVDHAAWRMVFGVDVPEFLDAQPIDLRLAITVERELRLEHLGQMAAHAFGEEGVFRMEFKARGIIRLVAAVARHPHVAGCDAFDRTILVIEDFGGGKAGEDFNAQPFGLFGEPAAQIAEASRARKSTRQNPTH